MNKNHVIILAGGVGSRMGIDMPKQFLEVRNKPIIVYTIEKKKKNDDIDSILVVCKADWIDHLKSLINKYQLKKVKYIVEGGNCSHDSIRNGVFYLQNIVDANDYVIIHDAVRPIISDEIINDLIFVAHTKGNSCSSIQCHPPVVIKDDEESAIKDIKRESVMLTASPQMFKFSDLLLNYKKAEEEGKKDFTFTSSLFIYYGNRIFFSKGSTNNIKITKQEDLKMFEALLDIV